MSADARRSPVDDSHEDDEDGEEGATAAADAAVDDAQQEDEPKTKQQEEKAKSTSEWLMNLMKQSLGISGPEDKPPQVLHEVNFDGIVKHIKEGKCKNILTMAGAGISTSAGIPDFRSPGTGLYDNLQKYNLPSPQAVFEIGYFKENPEPFFQLARELWPGIFKPTPCHYFLRLLNEKGLLLRHFTQNIDTLERVAGLDGEKIVEAHGTFHTGHCVECRKEYTQNWMKEQIFASGVPKCSADDCEGTVKPDIVFFGEQLPANFFHCCQQDIPKADLLIIMGTSLVVQPFASLASRVPDTCPRLYINLEQGQGSSDPMMAMLGMGHGFKFEDEDNYRDVFWEGTCDAGCEALAEALGWREELKKIVTTEHDKIDAEIAKEKENNPSASNPDKSTGNSEGNGDGAKHKAEL